jgi:hypothetical protein
VADFRDDRFRGGDGAFSCAFSATVTGIAPATVLRDVFAALGVDFFLAGSAGGVDFDFMVVTIHTTASARLQYVNPIEGKRLSLIQVCDSNISSSALSAANHVLNLQFGVISCAI